MPGLLWGRVPKLFIAVAILYGVLDRRRSPLDPVLRSLVTVRVSQLNGCRFCVDINSATLARRAGSQAKVDALEAWRDSDLFDAKERAALVYAEAMTDSARRVTDASGLNMPRIIAVRSSDTFKGDDWLGLKMRDASIVRGIGVLPMFTGLLGLLLLLGGLAATWAREGR